MLVFIERSGNFAGLLGILVCLVAGISRMLGNWHTAGYATVTLFTLGIAFMVFACLAKLHALSARLSAQ